MGKQYSKQEQEEALKFAKEIGTAAASRRVGISADTIYSWQSKERKQRATLSSSIEESVTAELSRLRKRVKEQEEEIEILQDALGFFVERRKK